MDNVVCLNSNSYHGFSLEDAVEGARRAGIKFIEVAAVQGYTPHAAAEMSDEEIARIASLFADNDITPVGMCGHANIMTDEGRKLFVANLDLGRRLGVSYVVTGTGETHDDEDVIEDVNELVDVLQHLCDEAAKRSLVIGIETHGNNFGTGEQIAALIPLVNRDNFKITYDTANVIFYGRTQPYDDLGKVADEVVNVHLKDKAGADDEWNFPAVGTGGIDFTRVLSNLEANRSAPLSIEVEFTSAGPSSLEEVHEAVQVSAANTRALLGAR